MKRSSQQAPAAGVEPARIDETTCLAWDGVICVSCRYACTPRAITMDRGNRPVVEAESCTGCGLCVDVCPKNSIAILV